MERPPIEEYLKNVQDTADKLVKVGQYALAIEREKSTLERKNAAYDKANKDFQESLILANKEWAALEARLKWAEDLLKSTLDKLYRLDFSKGSRLSILIDDLEEALKGQ